MKLNKITADMVSRRPDQTAEWLNRLARQVDIVETDLGSMSKKPWDLPIATTYSLGVIKVGQNLSITPEGVLSALAPASYDYTLLFNKPKINNVELVGNKSLSDIGVGDATIKIQKNSVDVGSFTTNATVNKTIDISVPTKTSDLANDGSDGSSTYVENDDLTAALALKQNVLTAGMNINIVSDTISTQTRGIEYIVGTQVSATNLWTGISADNGCSNGTVYIGKTIAYYLPVAGNNSAATLNLTLPDGTTTGGIPLRRTVSGTITNHFSAGNVIIFTYDGTYWKMSAYYDSNDNYNTRLYNASIKAAAAITSGRLCIGTSSGYKMIASGVESDITYPILYAGSNVSAGSTNDNFYTIIRSINLQNTKSGWTGVATQEVWLAGTLSGSTFTVDSTVFTQTIPTTEDGKTYTPIGITYNTNAIFFCPSNVYWQYRNGEFRPISHPESDPIFSASAASGITSTDISNWNSKQDALTQAQLNAVNSGIDSTKVAQIATNTGNITSVTNRVTTIEGKIPSTATSSNKLTDKDYVDNAVATNSANYISDNGQPFQSLADLQAYSGPLTNNDYAFVVSTDAQGNTIYTRYKYNASTQTWAEEYSISNPTFSSTQWAAIDSGVTANDVAQITTNKNDIASLQSGKQDKLTTAQQAAVDSGIDSTKVQQIATNATNITNLQNNKQDKLSQAQLDAVNSGITAAKVTKLDGIEAGAEVNVQSDWNEANSSSDAYIKNKPTIGNATLTIQRNGSTAQTFTANATSNKSVDIQAPVRVDLTSTTQTAAYRRSVIALCRVTTADKVEMDSFSSGKITFHRSNGLSGIAYIDVYIENAYYGAYAFNFSYTSNVNLLPDTAAIDTATGFRPCVFKKDNVWYAGVELYLAAAQYHQVIFDGETNFGIFGLDYYRVEYTSSGTTYPAEVLDQEVYDSIDYTTVTYLKDFVAAKSFRTEDGFIKRPGYTATLPTKNGTLAMTSDINNATLTIQKNGSSVGTFTANASSNVTANISVPTKTSELTNDSGFVTDTSSQSFAAQEGSTNPVFDDMTPIKTFTWTVADTTYRPVYQFDNTGWNYGNMDITVAYRITVTGTGISQTTDIVDRWFSPGSWPVTSIMARTLSTSAATTGYRYLRAVYPVSAYLNNNTYKFGQEIAAYNSTSRTVQVEVFKTNSLVTWNETKPAGPIYQGSTYQTSSSMEPYGTRGWIFRKPANFVANSADQATAISDYERYSPGSSVLKSGATALVAGHFAFLAEDGLVYDISNTAKAISVGESKVGWIASGVNANTAINQTYWRMISRPNATQYGYFGHDTSALGDRVYLRCTMDSSGKIHSDNYLAKEMSPGYTWMPMGFMTTETTFYADTRFPKFYTLDANGNLTHVDGKAISCGGSVVSVTLDSYGATTPWNQVALGAVIAQSGTPGSTGGFYEEVLTFEIPSPVLSNDATGDNLTVADLYALLNSGVKVSLNKIPLPKVTNNFILGVESFDPEHYGVFSRVTNFALSTLEFGTAGTEQYYKLERYTTSVIGSARVNPGSPSYNEEIPLGIAVVKTTVGNTVTYSLEAQGTHYDEFGPPS